MNNNVRHSVGDKVVALTNPKTPASQPRIKGEIYTVKSVIYCCTCGVQMINIGYSEPSGTTRCTCKNRQANNNLAFTRSSNFAPLSETTLQHAVEEENYELAAIIRDALKTEKV